MKILKLEAPFGTFRTFCAASFRPTAGFITHSSAYGLILNICGIEMRFEDNKSEMTLIKEQLPKFSMAIAAIEFPAEQTMFQQLHNYPVGNTGKEHKPFTKGSKYNIKPVKRAYLSPVKAYLVIADNHEIEMKLEEGINGDVKRSYGLPFLGDNSFIIDKLDIVTEIVPSHWYVKMNEPDETIIKNRITRMTQKINRADHSKTKTGLFAPLAEPVSEIPDAAWVNVGY